MSHYLLLLALPAIFLGWTLGYNNMSAIFGPPVVAGVIKYRTSTILAAIFIILGTIIGGSAGMKTVSSIASTGVIMAVSASLGTAIVVLVLSAFSLPVSITQGIAGALIGIGIVNHTTQWGIVEKIITMSVIAPFGAIVIAYLTHKTVSVFYNRIGSIRVKGTFVRLFSLSVGIYTAYSFGADNVANITGPFIGAEMFNVQQALIFGAAAMALGVLTSSKKVIYTVGSGITVLEPFDAAIALFSEASTLLIFSIIGVPISSVQAIVGAVIGVGLVKGTRMIDSKTLIRIISGWIVTPIATGTIAVIIYSILKIWR